MSTSNLHKIAGGSVFRNLDGKGGFLLLNFVYKVQLNIFSIFNDFGRNRCGLTVHLAVVPMTDKKTPKLVLGVFL